MNYSSGSHHDQQRWDSNNCTYWITRDLVILTLSWRKASSLICLDSPPSRCCLHKCTAHILFVEQPNAGSDHSIFRRLLVNSLNFDRILVYGIPSTLCVGSLIPGYILLRGPESWPTSESVLASETHCRPSYCTNSSRPSWLHWYHNSYNHDTNSSSPNWFALTHRPSVPWPLWCITQQYFQISETWAMKLSSRNAEISRRQGLQFRRVSET